MDVELKNDWLVNIHGGYRNVEVATEQFKVGDKQSDNTWAFAGWNKEWADLYNVGMGITKELGSFTLATKGDVLFVNNSTFVNASVQSRYYPSESNRLSFVIAQVGVGTAPEASIIDAGLPGTFNNINSSVGIGYHWMLTGNMALLLQGDWYTFYSQNNLRVGAVDSYKEVVNTRYKNMFNLYMQLNISF